MLRHAARRLASRSAVAGRRALSTAEVPAQAAEDSSFVEAWKKVAPNIEAPETPMSLMQPRPPTPATIPTKLTVNFVLPYKSEIANKEGFGSARSGDWYRGWGDLEEVCAFNDLGRSGVIEECSSVVSVVRLMCVTVDNSRSIYDEHDTCLVACDEAKYFVHCLQLGILSEKVDMVIVPATTGQMGVLPGHVATIAELKPGVLSVHEGNDITKYFVSSGFAFVHANSVADIVAVEAVPLDQIDPSSVQKGLTDFTAKLGSASTDLEKAEAQIGVDVHSALNAALAG
ncbi:hypothetical protein EJB05_12468 [Eragrostis curvula]|uniref:ATP synthase F1 complex delta/epsilon subunit N-terminal domain-containing protein n=1 Tax=Eragrostis curvula TaxID=38414 RepID=A0A5J9VU19_9POAL|nr:hypothetical protein EJB05_12468 [Eragrostis curvula]